MLVQPMLPLELFLADWDSLSSARIDDLAVLLGAAPGTPVDHLKLLAARMRRYYGVHCHEEGRVKYCVYFYRVVSASPFLQYPVLAAMRGSVVMREGEYVKQIGFPFAKFFNVGETDATRAPPLRGFVATEKVDDTLIVGFRVPDGRVGLATRKMTWAMSPYGYSPPPGRPANPFVDVFLAAVDRHGLSLDDVVTDDRTVMFGLVIRGRPASFAAPRWGEERPEQFYDKTVPYLLAYRDMRTLEVVYPGPGETDFPLPPRYDFVDAEEAGRWVIEHPEREGVVLHYPGRVYDGRFPWWHYTVKLKNPVYVARSLFMYGEERRGAFLVVKAVLAGRLDDVIAAFGPDSEVAANARRVAGAYSRLAALLADASDKLREEYRRRGRAVLKEMQHNIRGPIGRALADIALGAEPERVAKRLSYIVAKGKDITAAAHGLERLVARIEKVLRTRQTGQRTSEHAS